MSNMADAIEAAAKALWDVDRTSSDREYEECREGTKRHLRREVGAVIAALSPAGFGPVQAARAEALEQAANLAEVGEGGGVDSGECDDWSSWLRSRAVSERGEG